jgi:hypothetical protein
VREGETFLPAQHHLDTARTWSPDANARCAGARRLDAYRPAAMKWNERSVCLRRDRR